MRVFVGGPCLTCQHSTGASREDFSAATPRLLPSVVSLFSGAGGLDVGLERAGWHTVLATDHDADCVATLTSNQQARIRIAEQAARSYLDGARVVRADVTDLAAADLRPPGVTRTWRPALLTGGPPVSAVVLSRPAAWPRRSSARPAFPPHGPADGRACSSLRPVRERARSGHRGWPRAGGQARRSTCSSGPSRSSATPLPSRR